MPIDHAGVWVAPADHKKTIEWYLAALKPLNYVQITAFGPNEEYVGLGENYKPDWWVLATAGEVPNFKQHVAFTTTDRKVVDAFHEAAIQAGGKDNGKPGLRTTSHPNYYAAYVYDPVGNNIEVVCHLPQDA